MTNLKPKFDKFNRAVVADVTGQLAALGDMTVGELRERYREVFGVPTRSRNKDYLFKKIAWRIQELAEGGLSESALAKIEELAVDAPVRWRQQRPPSRKTVSDGAGEKNPADRDPRLPPSGTVLTRDFKGVEHKVTVHEGNFEYQGQRYNSLSQIARLITNTNWNGYLFWGLARRTKRESQPAKETL